MEVSSSLRKAKMGDAPVTVEHDGSCYKVIYANMNASGIREKRTVRLDKFALFIDDMGYRFVECPGSEIKKKIFKTALLRGWISSPTCSSSIDPFGCSSPKSKFPIYRDSGTSTDDLGLAQERISSLLQSEIRGEIDGEFDNNRDTTTSSKDDIGYRKIIGGIVKKIRDRVEDSVRESEKLLKSRFLEEVVASTGSSGTTTSREIKKGDTTPPTSKATMESSSGNRGSSSREIYDRPQNPNLVFFDLETTGLNRMCSIIQIAACARRDGACFEALTLPTAPIESGAAGIHGFALVKGSGCGGGDRLTRYGKPVFGATDHCTGMRKFVEFLADYKPVVLVAHNNFSYDMPILLRHIAKCGLTADLAGLVVGMADTLPLFRQLIRPRHGRYSLECLVRTYLGSSGDNQFHDALADTRNLARLCRRFEVDEAKCFSDRGCYRIFAREVQS